MAEPVPAGSDVPLRRHLRLHERGNTIGVGSTPSLPPCPNCGNGEWRTESGGDSVDDPYPDR